MFRSWQGIRLGALLNETFKKWWGKWRTFLKISDFNFRFLQGCTDVFRLENINDKLTMNESLATTYDIRWISWPFGEYSWFLIWLYPKHLKQDEQDEWSPGNHIDEKTSHEYFPKVALTLKCQHHEAEGNSRNATIAENHQFSSNKYRFRCFQLLIC